MLVENSGQRAIGIAAYSLPGIAISAVGMMALKTSSYWLRVGATVGIVGGTLTAIMGEVSTKAGISNWKGNLSADEIAALPDLEKVRHQAQDAIIKAYDQIAYAVEDGTLISGSLKDAVSTAIYTAIVYGVAMEFLPRAGAFFMGQGTALLPMLAFKSYMILAEGSAYNTARAQHPRPAQ